MIQITIKRSLLYWLFSLFVAGGYSQNVIYLIDGKKMDVQIINEDSDRIFYQNFQTKGKTKKLNVSKVLMIFREEGACEVFRGGQKKNIPASPGTDYLLTRTRELIPVRNARLSDPYVEAAALQTGDPVNISRNNVLAILFWNGTHTFFGTSSEVAYALFDAKMEEPSAPTPSSPQAENEPIDTPPAGSPTPPGQNPAPTQTEPTPTTPPVDSQPPVDTPPVQQTSLPPSTDGGMNTSPIEPMEEKKKGPVMPIPRAEFERKTLKRVKDFESNVQRLMDHRIDAQEVRRIKNRTRALFIHDSSYVEVSSARTQRKRQFRLLTYLDRLTRLPYSKVDVQWADVNLVGDLRKGENNLWYGTTTFQQRFRGMNSEGQVLYEDVTVKKMEVVLKELLETINGEVISQWEVFLSNILVESTRTN